MIAEINNLWVERIINTPIDSNCFIVYSENFKTCVVIDPGSELCEDIFKFMKSKQLEPEYIFLTHEHFDHIWGIEKLRERFKCKLVASNLCSLLITNAKKNLSIFYNQKGFECKAADLIMEDLSTPLIWQTYPISLYATPGHSDASICIQIGNYLFTGDTLMKNIKTPTKLPGGNVLKLEQSMIFIHNNFWATTKIMPGHGETFLLLAVSQ